MSVILCTSPVGSSSSLSLIYFNPTEDFAAFARPSRVF
eukprot:COSAG05_NODE_22795_length_262_cov_0.638037_1_plen_37_part_01